MAGLILVRHPRTGAPPGLCYGRHEPPCGPNSAAALDALVGLLERPSALVSSASPRCLEPARALSRRFARALRVDPDWRELDFGDWEGRYWSDIDRAESDPWAEDPLRRAPPGGESFNAMLKRVAQALSRAPDGAVVITHAGAIRAARMICEDWTFQDAFAAPVPYAEPIEIRI